MKEGRAKALWTSRRKVVTFRDEKGVLAFGPAPPTSIGRSGWLESPGGKTAGSRRSLVLAEPGYRRACMTAAEIAASRKA